VPFPFSVTRKYRLRGLAGASYPQARVQNVGSLISATISGPKSGIAQKLARNPALDPRPMLSRKSHNHLGGQRCPSCVQRQPVPSSDWLGIQDLAPRTCEHLALSRSQKRLRLWKIPRPSGQSSRCRKHGEQVANPVARIVQYPSFGDLRRNATDFSATVSSM